MMYEKPIMNVMQFTNLDIVRTSDEVVGGGLGGIGGGDNPGTDVNGGQSSAGQGYF